MFRNQKMHPGNSYGVLLGCFAINFFIAGAARLSSIFFVESITRYNVDRKQASFPFVLTYMIRHLSGPVVGYLEQIFGMQKIIFIGCVLASVSIGSCFFAEDIVVIDIFWGIIFGLSFGCAHHMLPSLLNSYFPGHESTANGISLSGACVGAVLLPVIMKACIVQYGLSASFLILSAIISNTIPASLLIKNYKKSNATSFNDVAENFMEKNNLKTMNGEINQNNYAFNGKIHPLNTIEVNKDSKYCINVQNNSKLDPKNKISSFVSPDKSFEIRINKGSDKNMFSLQSFRIFTDPIYIIILIIHCGGMTLAVTVWTIILDFVRDKNVGEHLEIYYVALLPLSDLVGRFGSGFILDKNFLSKPNMTLVCFLITAVLLIAFIFTSNYILLMMLELLIAVFLGAIFLLQIVLIHQFMEVGKKTMAMTCRFIFYAPLSLGISPMIGYFRGDNGAYDNVFYILCGVSLFCGSSAYFIPWLVKKKALSLQSSLKQ